MTRHNGRTIILTGQYRFEVRFSAMSSDARKKQIMQSVEKLLATKQLHEITTDDVAQCAHVGKGTLYRYFRDKDDLFFETAAHGFSELCDLLDRNVDIRGDFQAHLAATCAQITHFLGRRRQLFRTLHSEEPRTYWHRGGYRQRWMEHRQRLLASVERILARGVERGAVRRDIPVGTLAMVLLGLVRMSVRELRDCTPPLEGPDWLVDLFLRGAGGNFAGIVPGEPGAAAGGAGTQKTVGEQEG